MGLPQQLEPAFDPRKQIQRRLVGFLFLKERKGKGEVFTFFGWASSTSIVWIFSTGASVYGCETGVSPSKAEKASIKFWRKSALGKY